VCSSDLEDQAQKLDRLNETLQNHPLVTKSKEFMRENPEVVQWAAIGVFAGLGVLLIRKLLSNLWG